jgi:hypothetical protein
MLAACLCQAEKLAEKFVTGKAAQHGNVLGFLKQQHPWVHMPYATCACANQ